MTQELEQKALELAIAVQRLEQLTKELQEYSDEIQALSKRIQAKGLVNADH